MQYYNYILDKTVNNKKCLAILVDPDKFNVKEAQALLNKIPKETTHFFVGGSIVKDDVTKTVVLALKKQTMLPVFLFPGNVNQITKAADGLLFLSLLSGRNPQFLIEQQVKAVPKLLGSKLEIIATGYILVNGGTISSVEKVSNTKPISQDAIDRIVHTALAGQFMGAKMIYLEAGSGAKVPVKQNIIKSVKKVIDIPLIVGGGIKTETQKQIAYNAGADMVVMGTVFEN